MLELNAGKMTALVLFHSVTPLDSLAGAKVPEIPLRFLRNFFPKHNVLEFAYYFFRMNKCTPVI